MLNFTLSCCGHLAICYSFMVTYVIKKVYASPCKHTSPWTLTDLFALLFFSYTQISPKGIKAALEQWKVGAWTTLLV